MTRAAIPDVFSTAELSRLRRRAFAISAALWLFEWVLFEIAIGLTIEPSYETLFFWRIGWVASGLIAGAIIWKIAEPLLGKPFWQMAATVMGLALIFGFAHAVANRMVFFEVIGEWPADGRLAGQLYSNARFWLNFYFAWAAIILAYIYATRVRLEQEGRTQAQAMAQQAQVQAFRYQVHPHFLFNTFNSIAAMILDGERSGAERLVRRLSAYLRRGLASSANDDISIARELAQQVEYLELEKERFPDRLRVETEIDPALAQPSIASRAVLPGFILQPIVENAIRHGVMESRDTTLVRLAAEKQQDRLVVTVTNTPQSVGGSRTGCVATSDSGEVGFGQGLQHVRSRLTSRYRSDFAFEHGPDGSGGYRAMIDVPLAGGSA